MAPLTEEDFRRHLSLARGLNISNNNNEVKQEPYDLSSGPLSPQNCISGLAPLLEEYLQGHRTNSASASPDRDISKPLLEEYLQGHRSSSTRDSPDSNRSSSSSTSSNRASLSGQPYKSPFILYELSDDLKRKEFLDDLFPFMSKRGTPINRLPIMAKQVLDLYELYNLVVARGGLVEVINKKLWQEIIKGLKLPSSITSAAFTLRTQYMKYLYPYECEKMKLSNPADLQCAIDGNRREGRRSSYGMEYLGPYGEMVQPPFLPGLPNLQSLQNLQNLGNPLLRPQLNGNASPHPLAPHDYLLGRGGSPPGSQEALLEATRLTMWKLYNQGLVGGNQVLGGPGGPPPMHNDTQEDGPKPPPPHHPLLGATLPPQKEALNLHKIYESPASLPGLPGFLQRPQLKSPSEIRERQEEQGIVPPAAKRQAAAEEDPMELRFPPPSTPTPTPTGQTAPGANIKITSRGDGRSSDQSLVVSMEINGILYQGVLFAQAPRQRLT